MTKKELTKAIAADLGIPQSTAAAVVQKAFEGIIETLVHDGRLELRNFGVFEVKHRKARQARNPRTGEKVLVPDRRVITFKPGREMAARLGKLKKVAATVG